MAHGTGPAQREAFDQFWALYPRKVGKLAAQRKWSALNPDLDLVGAIMTALAWQRAQWTDPRFIPHPATWLHQGRWLDEPFAPRRPAADLTTVGGINASYVQRRRKGVV